LVRRHLRDRRFDPNLAQKEHQVVAEDRPDYGEERRLGAQIQHDLTVKVATVPVVSLSMFIGVTWARRLHELQNLLADLECLLPRQDRNAGDITGGPELSCPRRVDSCRVVHGRHNGRQFTTNADGDSVATIGALL
jgi:hypothetical protein